MDPSILLPTMFMVIMISVLLGIFAALMQKKK